MVRVKEDMTGWKMWEHGVPDSRLIVVKQTDDYISPKGKREARWLCKCNCGNDKEILVRRIPLITGTTKSCGCKRKDNTIDYNKTKIKYNKYDLSGEYGIGWTSNTHKEFYFDLEDYDKIKDYCWYEEIYNNYHCLKTNIKNSDKYIRMHSLLGFKNYDHINRNPLDNRKENFRKASRLENGQNKSRNIRNTSGITGVYYHKKTNKWASKIGVNYKIIYLGEFLNKENAIKARLEAEFQYYGEFAPQRHLFEKYGIKIDNKEESNA